ncbi:penicillin-binding protein activator [Methylomonas sp. UP202]|uniref:penicillin-binding protein activator n=1 Tax=Methylomonas sp. UP202 TaxID=3040943 RepID=UPI00247A695B|nr:penicillin-binding protein activator [Methylomonas sp. UP202]WGS86403.1 penicillin-binding protein activator [Methylomonas sp. UP202]
MSDFKFAAIMPARLAACWVFGLLLTACAEEPVKSVKPQAARAKSAAKRGKPNEPAQSYRIADNQNGLHLLDADTRIQAGDSEAAQKALDRINPEQLTPEQLSKYKLLDAQISLSAGDAERALHKLEGTRPAVLAEADRIAYYQSLAFVHALLGDVLPSVRARLKLGQLLQAPEQQRQNIAAILDALSVLPVETLNASAPVADELGGWMALAKILKQRGSPGFDLSGQIAGWRQAYPYHPANAEYLQTYLNAPAAAAEPAPSESAIGPASATSAAGANLAVLLPSAGPYAPAAKAITEGLSVAHRLAASAAPQPGLKFYDTSQGEPGELYRKAIAEGAGLVIGPLVKEDIQSLALSSELTIPVLALNQVDNLGKANLYQFGLSPQDEAEQLARKARRDGLQNAVFLVPNTPQGQRVGHFLTSAWQAGGGSVVGLEQYDPKQHDFSGSVATLLAPSVSIDGKKQPLAVFVSASPEVARELAPQLKYPQSAELSIYAMPNLYSGRQNPVRDVDLGAIRFCDMPWLFGEYYPGPLSQSALQNIWQGLPDSQIKLVALGVDAYNLSGQLTQLAGGAYAGATGRLTLTGENRIGRALVCAQFKAGVPIADGFLN